jgi:site-specific DNA-methyltransferase (adenine-specific)
VTWHPDTPTEYRNAIVTGDAMELAKRLPDESVDLVLTDPPYGIGHKYANGTRDSRDGYDRLIRWLVQEAERVLKPGALAFVFQASPRLRETWQWFPPESRLFIGGKSFVQIRPALVQWAYDPAVFWQKPGPLRDYRRGRDYFFANTSNTLSRGLDEAGFHTCPKALDLMTYMAECFCPPGGVIADFFMGSGSTAAAAKLTGRSFCGFESDPEVANLARERLTRTPVPLLVTSETDAPETQPALW